MTMRNSATDETLHQEPTRAEIEDMARAHEPHVWALEPPDCSSARYRLASLARAEDVLRERRGFPLTRAFG